MASRPKSSICAGKRIIDEDHAMAIAGYEVEHSYMNESSMVSTLNESDHLNDTVTRKWKKEGVPMKEIMKRKMKMAQNNIDEVQGRLDAALNGAKTFGELLKTRGVSNADQFAVPKLPRSHNEENSLVRSPVASTSSGRAGLSCSTPKGGANITMRSLKCLDISQVINTGNLDVNITHNVHNISVTIPVANEEQNSNDDRTFTIAKDQSDSVSLQKTHTIREEDGKMKSTFTIHNDSNKEAESEKSASLQKTHTIREDDGQMKSTFTIPNDSHKEPELEKTYVVESEKSAAQNNTIVIESHSSQEKSGKEKRKSNKTTLEEREKRNITLGNDMLSSFMSETPSPGAQLFKRNRKKMRPSVPTPPRNPAISRLSVDSNKEKTIEMLTIVENTEIEVSEEHATASYVDAVFENGNDDKDATVDVSKNKSTIMGETPIRHAVTRTPIERSRANSTLHRVLPSIGMDTVTPGRNTGADCHALRNYEKPTISSLNRSVKKTGITPASICRGTPLANRLEMDMDVQMEKNAEEQAEDHVENETGDLTSNAEPPVGIPENIHDPSDDDNGPNMEEGVNDQSAKEVGDLQDSLDELSVNDDNEGPAGSPDQSSSHQGSPDLTHDRTPINKPRRAQQGRRRVMIDDSPDVSIEQDDYSVRRSRRNKKAKVEPMVLAKRTLIKPEVQTGGLRRSTRTRCKPVRSWLGEHPIYVDSPSGGRRLAGVTDVTITDRRYCKYRTADPRLATERQHLELAERRRIAALRREQLQLDHSMGKNLNMSQDDIHTSDEE